MLQSFNMFEDCPFFFSLPHSYNKTLYDYSTVSTIFMFSHAIESKETKILRAN